MSTSEQGVATMILDRPEQSITWKVAGFDFIDIGTVLPLANGSIVATHTATGQILRFSITGSVENVVGGTGTGARQFQRLGSVGQIGDTIWAIDAMRLRVHMYRADLTFIRSLQLPLIPTPPDARLARPLMLLANGRVLAASSVKAADQTRARDVSLLILAKRDGSAPRAIAQLSQSHVNTSVRLPDATMYRLPPAVEDQTMVAQDPQSARIVLVDRQVSPTNGPAHFGLTMLSSDGDTLWHHLVPSSRTVVSPAFIATMRRELGSKVSASFADSLVKSIPNSVIDVFSVVVGTGGIVWLGERTHVGEHFRWRLFDSSGVQRRIVQLSSHYRIVGATRRDIWAVRVGDGLPSLDRFIIPDIR